MESALLKMLQTFSALPDDLYDWGTRVVLIMIWSKKETSQEQKKREN